MLDNKERSVRVASVWAIAGNPRNEASVASSQKSCSETPAEEAAMTQPGEFVLEKLSGFSISSSRNNVTYNHFTARYRRDCFGPPIFVNRWNRRDFNDRCHWRAYTLQIISYITFRFHCN